MNIDILTLFPEMFAPLHTSMLGRAEEKGILRIRTTDIRDFTRNKHNRTDDYPFGGGGGMVMMPDPVFRALEHIGMNESRKLIYMSPRGKVLDEEKIKELSELDDIVILCGHYEGVDQRILDEWNAEEISIGDYVLTGGELPAMVLIDAVARLLPGVLGNSESAMNESVYSGLLEHPQYTQPREYRGIEVPEVLLSGNHKRIALWKFRESLILTKSRRPEMFDSFIKDRENFTKDERKIIEEVCKMDV